MSRLSEHSLLNSFSQKTSEFTLEQRRFLLRIAHGAIASAFADDSPENTAEPPAAWPGLSAPRGVFTTLYLDGLLRGCIGYATASRPLLQAVAETARAAAFDDGRFLPVTAEELSRLKISLSILSPLFPVTPERVEVGRHGLVISDGGRRGLLLPQVPVDSGWDRVKFLQETCRKAGLGPDAWQKSAHLEAFTAEVFGDDDVDLVDDTAK